MTSEPTHATNAARILGHAVPLTLPGEEGRPLVALSAVGDPPRSRVAWVDLAGERIVARVACPPGVPSRWRPVVASDVTLDLPGTEPDRVLVARAAPDIPHIQVILAWDGEHPVAPVGPDGLVAVRLPGGVGVDAVDALDARGEPVGRLTHVGIALLRSDGATVGGRMGAGHGMAAGIGHGHWVDTVEDAAWEAGYTPRLPAWVPRGLEMSRFRIEPELAFPAAPPAVIVAWSDDAGARVLLRQTVAPLASPDPGGALAQPMEVNGAPGVLRGRGLATLVWQTHERAYGIQVRGMDDAVVVARDVARAVPL